MSNNVFLVKVVSFSNATLILYNDENEMPFETEEYRLVYVIDNWAYDLNDIGRRYHIIDTNNYTIPDEEIIHLKPRKQYVFDMYPFDSVWNTFHSALGVRLDKKRYFASKITKVKKLHEDLEQSKKSGTIIDISHRSSSWQRKKVRK